MHAVLVWLHVVLLMAAFSALPLGRLGLRFFLTGVSAAETAQLIVRKFSRIFLVGGILVTAGVGAGLVLAWETGLTLRWVTASLALIAVAGIGGVAIEDRWVKRLLRAQGDAFAAVLQEQVPLLAALVSPVLWLSILWLMIAKPV